MKEKFITYNMRSPIKMDRDGALDKLKIIFMVNLNIRNYHLACKKCFRNHRFFRKKQNFLTKNFVTVEAIKETDPDFRESNKRNPGYPSSPMLNGGGQVSVPPQHQQQTGAQRRERHPAEVRVRLFHLFFKNPNNEIDNLGNYR